MDDPDAVLTALTTDERIALLSGDGPWSAGGVPRLGIDPVVLTDGPHGVRLMADPDRALELDRAVPATCFPTAAALGSSWDADLLARVGRALGAEARALGVGVLLGPGLNIKRHPRGGRSFEYLSEDPEVSGVLAAAMVRGIQSHGVAACPKHYAVNNQESDRMVVDVVVDPRTLHEVYLRGFEIAVTEGRPWTAMCAYNRVNGTYASQHRWLLTDVLRDRWGFDGVVVSDWGAVDDRVEGIRAGLDLEMPGGAGPHDARIARALADGRLGQDEVDACAGRVLAMGRRVRQDGPAGGIDATTAGAHHELAREAAAAGTVLLRNAGGVLPLARGASVALIGPFADGLRQQGAGSSKVSPLREEGFADALAAVVPGLRVDDGSRPARAAALAAEVDVAVVAVGLPEAEESEGFDRDHLRLPPAHDDLVRAVAAANPRTAVVLSLGAPALLPWADDVAAVVTGYLGGQAGASAMAGVLAGNLEPGGRLAETWPVDEADLPASRHFPGTPQQVAHREGPLVGYRAMATLDRLPRFAFGHGLSYTRIDLSDVRLSAADVQPAHLTDGNAVTVSLTATNVGERRGSEVVQVYVRRPRSAVPRPALELAAFAKVDLEPGESEVVRLRVGVRAFRHWDVGADGWAVEEGPVELLVGRSSADLPHVLALQVGTASPPGPTPRPPASMDDVAFAEALGRPIPVPEEPTGFTRNSQLRDLRRTAAGRVVRRALLRAITRQVGADASAATRKAFQRGADELPLRGLVLFSGGALTFDDLHALLECLNGRWGRGLRCAVGSARRRRGR